MNLLTAQGTIIKQDITPDGRVNIVIATDGGRPRQKTDKIRFICFDSDMLRPFTIKDRVTVLGHIQPLGSRTSAENWDTRTYTQEYIADSVSLSERDAAHYFSMPTEDAIVGGHAPDENRTCHCGKFVSVKQFKPDKNNSPVVGITIEIISAADTAMGATMKHSNKCNFVCFGRQAETALKIAEKAAKGEECRVAITGSIRTDSRSGKNGAPIFLQNIVARDIYSPSVPS